MADSSKKKNTITMVCTGNTCRSPMAEKLLQHALGVEAEPLKSLKVVSAGISAFEGSGPSENSVKAMAKIKLSLDDHRSRMLNDKIVDSSFAIFCMTEAHREAVRSHFGNEHDHVYLLREFIPKNDEKEISDPIGQGLHAYEDCRDSMVESIPHIIKFLKENYK
jgi:protein-tyrosine-phosphatase